MEGLFLHSLNASKGLSDSFMYSCMCPFIFCSCVAWLDLWEAGHHACMHVFISVLALRFLLTIAYIEKNVNSFWSILFLYLFYVLIADSEKLPAFFSQKVLWQCLDTCVHIIQWFIHASMHFFIPGHPCMHEFIYLSFSLFIVSVYTYVYMLVTDSPYFQITFCVFLAQDVHCSFKQLCFLEQWCFAHSCSFVL